MKNPIPVELRARLSASFADFAEAINVPDADYAFLFKKVSYDLESFKAVFVSQMVIDALSKTPEDSESEV